MVQWQLKLNFNYNFFLNDEYCDEKKKLQSLYNYIVVWKYLWRSVKMTVIAHDKSEKYKNGHFCVNWRRKKMTVIAHLYVHMQPTVNECIWRFVTFYYSLFFPLDESVANRRRGIRSILSSLGPSFSAPRFLELTRS